MAVELLLLKLSPSMQEARVVRFLAQDGDEVAEGQPLFAVEAEGSSHEVEAPATGTLKITAAAGATYEVGTVLGHIE